MKKLIAAAAVLGALVACAACGQDPVVTEVPVSETVAPLQYPNGSAVASPDLFIALLEGNGYPSAFDNEAQHISDGWTACAAAHTGTPFKLSGVSAKDAATLSRAAQTYLCPRTGTSGGTAPYSPS